MTIVGVMTFSKQGKKTAERLFATWQDAIPLYYMKDTPREAWMAMAFSYHMPILFVGAAGIAVRLIAPCIKDKLQDSPVIVMDERGAHVIPILSGHMGGANVMAVQMAKQLGAEAVLTTATDVEGVFAVDVFARKNGFCVWNRDGIRVISQKMLEKETVRVAIEKEIIFSLTDMPKNFFLVGNEEKADLWIGTKPREEETALQLIFQPYVLGMGCKKGKDFTELQPFVDAIIKERKIKMSEVYAMASIDIKRKEWGLLYLSCFYHLPFFTYTAEQLQAVSGSFSESGFVAQVTGVPNVCERASMAAAGEDAELVMKKQAKDGMTIAIAKRKPQIMDWSTDVHRA